jgi:hypothetical protein
MSTDQCAYHACGDPHWVNRALWTVPVADVAGAGFAALGFARLSRGKVAFWAPLLGLVVLMALLAVAWWMAGLAGSVRTVVQIDTT